MPTLSIVIVTFHVKPFISLCLDSIRQSDYDDYEIIAVDNASKDGSADWIAEHHPEVRLLRQSDNLGFSKACNIGAGVAQGEYILFLNPDVILEQHYLSMILTFMDANDHVGAVGGAMYDGSLELLPESKRRFPTLLNSLGRLTKVDKLFKGSSLDYYDRREGEAPMTIDVLSGANMCFRRDAFDRVGGFDEDYFMYGEDIDICLQIKKAGYSCSYIPDARLIHFKGESTSKRRYGYFKHFYRSLGLYAQKNRNAPRLALALTKFLGAAHYLTVRLLRPLLVFIGLAVLLLLTGGLWSYFYHDSWTYVALSDAYPLLVLFPALITFCLYVSGYFVVTNGDRRLVGLSGYAIGAVVCVLVYALLPESMRYSRPALLIFLAIGFLLVRLLTSAKRDSSRASVLASDITDDEMTFLNRIYSGGLDASAAKENTLVVESRSLDMDALMSHSQSQHRALHFWDRSRSYIYFSQSGTAKGELYDKYKSYNLTNPFLRHQKRIFDLGITFLSTPIVLIGAVLLFRLSGLQRWLDLLMGRLHVVGYCHDEQDDLPQLLEGVLTPRSYYATDILDGEVNHIYAQRYHVGIDALVLSMRILSFYKKLFASIHTD